MKWIGKKKDFVNVPIYSYENLGSVGYIMIGKLKQLSTDTTTIIFTTEEPLSSMLYKRRCKLEVYCKWHGLRVPKACSELPREEPTKVLASWKRKQSNAKRLDHFHEIQKARKHLQGKAQDWAIEYINEITSLNDDKDISDFSNSRNNDFQKFLPTNIRHCC